MKRRQYALLSCSAIGLAALAFPGSAAAQDAAVQASVAEVIGEQTGPAGRIPDASVAAAIREIIEPGENASSSVHVEDPLELALRRAYAIRVFDPIWTADGAGRFRQSIDTLAEHGIDVDTGFRAAVETAIGNLASDDQTVRARADITLSRAYLLAADRQSNGMVDADEIERSTIHRPDPEPLGQSLAFAGRGAFDYATWTRDHAEYASLLEARAIYEGHVQAGGFTRLEFDGVLEAGDTDPVVAALRQRLAEEGFTVAPEYEIEMEGGHTNVLPVTDTIWSGAGQSATIQPLQHFPLTGEDGGDARIMLDSTAADEAEAFDGPPPTHAYTEAVATAVEAFQRANGLEVDGILGPRTIAALNITAEQKLARIDANLERWRWAPESFGDTHIRVNLPSFEVQGFEDGRRTISMATIVGMESRETPVFSDSVEYIIANPRWYVPESILRRDKLDDIQADPSYIEQRNFYVLDRSTGEQVDPYALDWNDPATPDNYRLVQDSGEDNALGRVKIMFPNEHSIYLHDTPSDHLFEHDHRAFSSGCIRLERPLEMARWVVRASGTVEQVDELENAFATDEWTRIDMAEPIPVHIVYFTVSTDEDGRVVFHDDIYDRDRAVIARLETSTLGENFQ